MTKKRTNFSKKMTEFFKERDVFGQPVNLNFNQRGSIYKSFIGAIITYLMFGLLFYLVAYKKGKDMFEKADPQIGEFEEFISTQNLGLVDLKQEKFLIFFSLFMFDSPIPFD